MDTKRKDPIRYLALCAFAWLACSAASLGQELTGSAATSPDDDRDVQVISESELEERDDGLAYRIGMPEPFTGKVVCKFYNGATMSVTNYLDGKRHGDATSWYQNGRMRLESSYNHGERDGVWTRWDEDGHVQFHRQYRNGSRVF